MKIKLNVWRQKDATSKGAMVSYDLDHVEADMSFLEMIDVLNEELISKGEEPVEFDHDCREGICGTCSMTINGRPHGPQHRTTACQLHMRSFSDGDTITVEPFRAAAFPVIKDLIVDRSAFDPFNKQVDTSRLTLQEILLMPMPFLLKKNMQICHLTRLLVSDVVLVLQPVKTLQQCSLPQPRFLSTHCFLRDR